MDSISVDTTPRPTHKIPCTPSQSQQKACLNGGVCKAVPSYDGGMEIFCECGEDWEGRRCEQVRIDFLVINSSMIVGIVAAIVIVLAFAIILVIFLIRVRKRRQQRRPQEQSTQQQPNTNTLPTHYSSNGRDGTLDSLLDKNGTQNTTV